MEKLNKKIKPAPTAAAVAPPAAAPAAPKMIFLQFDNVWRIKTCLHVNQPILSKTQFRRCQGGREIKQRCYLVKHLCAYFMCIKPKQVKHQSKEREVVEQSEKLVR